MASQLYESVMRHDAERDALNKKKPPPKRPVTPTPKRVDRKSDQQKFGEAVDRARAARASGEDNKPEPKTAITSEPTIGEKIKASPAAKVWSWLKSGKQSKAKAATPPPAPAKAKPPARPQSTPKPAAAAPASKPSGAKAGNRTNKKAAAPKGVRGVASNKGPGIANVKIEYKPAGTTTEGQKRGYQGPAAANSGRYSGKSGGQRPDPTKYGRKAKEGSRPGQVSKRWGRRKRD